MSRRISPQASAIISDPGSPGTPATPDAAPSSSPLNESVLRGGVRKIILAEGDGSNPEHLVQPFSQATISYSLFAVPAEAASSAAHMKKNADDDELNGGSSDDDSVNPTTPASALTKNSENYDGELVEEEPGATVTVGLADNLSALVPGLEIALLTMCVGEKARIIIPPVKGFEGHSTIHRQIRGNVLLVYELTVKRVVHEIDISPKKGDRTVTKYINIPGKHPNSGADGVSLLPYETTVNVKFLRVNSITEKPTTAEETQVIVGVSHSEQIDQAVSSMSVGEFSKVTFRDFSTRAVNDQLISVLSIQPPCDPSSFKLQEALDQALERKNRGNKQFQKGENAKAINSYQHALQFLAYDNFPTSQQSMAQARDELVAVCWGNAAQASLAVGEYKAAVQYATSAISAQQTNPKFYFRRAKAYRHLHLFAEARQDITLAQQFVTVGGSPVDAEAVRVEFEEINEEEARAAAAVAAL